MRMNLRDKAEMVAFETVVARKLVTREELGQWKTDPKFDARRGKYTIVFRNANSSRQIVIVVPAKCESHATYMKMTVEITAVIVNGKKTVPEVCLGDVFFDKQNNVAGKVRDLLRRRAA